MGKLVNLGSLCIDHVYKVRTLAGSGETVASSSHHIFPGGKGLNQSLAAARAGVEVVHVGCVGDDGGMLLEVLAAAGVNVDAVRRVTGEVSGHAVIQVNDRGENAIVIAGGANRLLQRTDMESAFDQLGAGDWLLLQNEVNDLPQVLKLAAASSANIAFNLAPVDGREQDYDLRAVDLLIVNDLEAAALAQSSDEDPVQVLELLRSRYPQMTIVLTLGEQGLIYTQAGSSIARLDAFPVTAVDETAAGDAFIGFSIGALLAGKTLPAALRQGCAAGALSVTRAGAASSIPSAEEVHRMLSRR